MSTPENTFIKSVHAYLPPNLYRMKNHNQYNGGIPDCWYSGDRADLWVEYKFEIEPMRDETDMSPDLSPLQLDWIVKRYAEGRNAAVIMGSTNGGVYLPAGQPFNMSAGDFRRRVVNRKLLAEYITLICSISSP